jgi:hypothetical protein
MKCGWVYQVKSVLGSTRSIFSCYRTTALNQAYARQMSDKNPSNANAVSYHLSTLSYKTCNFLSTQSSPVCDFNSALTEAS